MRLLARSLLMEEIPERMFYGTRSRMEGLDRCVAGHGDKTHLLSDITGSCLWPDDHTRGLRSP